MVSQAPPITTSPPLGGKEDVQRFHAVWIACVLVGLSLAGTVWTSETTLTAAWYTASSLTLGIASSVLVLLAMRTLLWWRYKPVGLPTQTVLPTLTVVIPAFNEGVGVQASIVSVLRSNYPTEKLRLVVIDDGSTDDTWSHIQEAISPFANRVTTVRFAENRGKRHALYEGFSRADSEVVATLDSDSSLQRDSLRHLVAPLVVDARVAAVAGKVLVQNRHRTLITRMLGVRYILGFDFVRAYQSRLRTVWCCPGALQAYRRETIVPELESWRDQHFLGARCTNGDDHAMTNAILNQGYDSVYQSNATVETIVPETYVQLTRMYTRWGRSATREGLRALRFAPRRARLLGPLWGALMLLDALLQPITIVGRLLFLLAGVALLVTQPLALVGAAAVTGVFGLIYAAIFRRSERSREWVFCVCYAYFALFALPWVQPYATLTVRGNKWLTRG
jgi:hyaluronan synthase